MIVETYKKDASENKNIDVEMDLLCLRYCNFQNTPFKKKMKRHFESVS